MKTVVILFMLSLVLTLLSIPGCSGANNVQTELPPPRPADIGKGRLINLSRINSIHDEFAPCISLHGTELILTSNRPRDLEPKMLDPEFRYGEALYTSIGKGTNWNEPTLLNPVSSFAEVNTGTMVSYGSGHVSYLSATYKKEGSGSADILVVMKNDDGYSELRPLMEINSLWWDSHPAISPDGQIMIFSSDRSNDPLPTETETKRNPHLWKSKKQADGSWSNPVQLPKPVNSDASEISPHFGSDGYLYFASNRNASRGYDIYRVQVRLESFGGNVEVLPEPINSADDDCFPWQSTDRSIMYFSSNRPGGLGGYDIWAAECFYSISVRGVVQLQESEKELKPASNIEVSITPSVGSVRTNENGEFTAALEPCKEYMVSVAHPECYEEFPPLRIVPSIPMALDTTVSLTITMKRKAPREIRTYDDNVPYFVTGYWKPNTTENYRKLLLDTARLHREHVNYLDLRDMDAQGGYMNFTDDVDRKFEEIYAAISEAVEAFSDECSPRTEPLDLVVIGYVDPLGLAWGKYPDETVETMDIKLPNGRVFNGRAIEKGTVMSDTLGNERLSHLRSFYTYQMIHTRMLQNEKYERLFKQKKVTWKYCGGHERIKDRKEYKANPLERKFGIHILMQNSEPKRKSKDQPKETKE